MNNEKYKIKVCSSPSGSLSTGEGGGRGRLALSLQSKIDNLNKPKGSLGRLESLALQIGMIQQTLSPKLTHPCHILFGGDHGIEREGVSFSPREMASNSLWLMQVWIMTSQRKNTRISYKGKWGTAHAISFMSQL